jgi:hypothetical protein
MGSFNGNIKEPFINFKYYCECFNIQNSKIKNFVDLKNLYLEDFIYNLNSITFEINI